MLENIQNILKKYDKKVWIMYNNENSDKYFCNYISDAIATNSICIITQKDIYLIIHELDSQNIPSNMYNLSNLHIIIYESANILRDIIEEIIAKLLFPLELLFSYSTMGDVATDILTHGEFLYLSKLFKAPYKKYNKKVKISSAEKIIYDLASPKTDIELERLRYLASITDKILKVTFEKIEISMSEIEIVKLTQNITNDIMKKYSTVNKITSYEMAWDNCPIVLTGENFIKGGHSLPSGKTLKRGDTIYFDFGIKAVYNDNMILYTDMQRMGYALKNNEIKPPQEVMKIFDTLVSSIEDGIEEMKPGVKGYKIDRIVRQKILKLGYPDYNHATGHPVGLEVHDIGVVISGKSKRSNLELIENGVYTLEPRISVINGGSIEEMIQVTKFGGIPLCNTQKNIYLVK